MIEHEAEPALMRSEAATLLKWIATLPDPLVQARSGSVISRHLTHSPITRFKS